MVNLHAERQSWRTRLQKTERDMCSREFGNVDVELKSSDVPQYKNGRALRWARHSVLGASINSYMHRMATTANISSRRLFGISSLIASFKYPIASSYRRTDSYFRSIPPLAHLRALFRRWGNRKIRRGSPWHIRCRCLAARAHAAAFNMGRVATMTGTLTE